LKPGVNEMELWKGLLSLGDMILILKSSKTQVKPLKRFGRFQRPNAHPVETGCE